MVPQEAGRLDFFVQVADELAADPEANLAFIVGRQQKPAQASHPSALLSACVSVSTEDIGSLELLQAGAERPRNKPCFRGAKGGSRAGGQRLQLGMRLSGGAGCGLDGGAAELRFWTGCRGSARSSRHEPSSVPPFRGPLAVYAHRLPCPLPHPSPPVLPTPAPSASAAPRTRAGCCRHRQHCDCGGPCCVGAPPGRHAARGCSGEQRSAARYKVGAGGDSGRGMAELVGPPCRRSTQLASPPAYTLHRICRRRKGGRTSARSWTTCSSGMRSCGGERPVRRLAERVRRPACAQQREPSRALPTRAAGGRTRRGRGRGAATARTFRPRATLSSTSASVSWLLPANLFAVLLAVLARLRPPLLPVLLPPAVPAVWLGKPGPAASWPAMARDGEGAALDTLQLPPLSSPSLYPLPGCDTYRRRGPEAVRRGRRLRRHRPGDRGGGGRGGTRTDEQRGGGRGGGGARRAAPRLARRGPARLSLADMSILC
jgi:hypothetical protein